MKKFFAFLLVLGLTFGFSGIASATFDDCDDCVWDQWVDYDYVGKYLHEGDVDFWYGLNIAKADDFRPGIDVVKWAKLYFLLDDDSYYDAKEYAWVWSEGSHWKFAGEVDQHELFGPYFVSGYGIDSLNEDGSLKVAVKSSVVYDGKTNDFKWKSVKLIAKGCRDVPEPATMFMLGLGLVGLAGYSRKKFMK